MKFWRRLSAKYTRSSLAGQVAIGDAYRAVFYGNADRGQQQMVLADLADRCGFFKVSPPGATATELAYREGKRAAYSEIFVYLSLSPEDVEALANAARHEAATNQQSD